MKGKKASSSSRKSTDADDRRSSRTEGNMAINRLGTCQRVKLTVKQLNQNSSSLVLTVSHLAIL